MGELLWLAFLALCALALFPESCYLSQIALRSAPCWCHLPFEVAEHGPHKLSDAAVPRWHHALQAHDEVPVVFGVEDDQLVLPRGNAHSGHLRQKERVMRVKTALIDTADQCSLISPAII